MIRLHSLTAKFQMPRLPSRFEVSTLLSACWYAARYASKCPRYDCQPASKATYPSVALPRGKTFTRGHFPQCGGDCFLLGHIGVSGLIVLFYSRVFVPFRLVSGSSGLNTSCTWVYLLSDHSDH